MEERIKFKADENGVKENSELASSGALSKAERYMSIGKKQSEMKAANYKFNKNTGKAVQNLMTSKFFRSKTSFSHLYRDVSQESARAQR